jgi:hypothetical protein
LRIGSRDKTMIVLECVTQSPSTMILLEKQSSRGILFSGFLETHFSALCRGEKRSDWGSN